MIERSRSIPLPGLAAHRRLRGLTQRQLGELAGVAHTTVQQLEPLNRGAYPQTMQKLATALRVEPNASPDRCVVNGYPLRYVTTYLRASFE